MKLVNPRQASHRLHGLQDPINSVFIEPTAMQAPCWPQLNTNHLISSPWKTCVQDFWEEVVKPDTIPTDKKEKITIQCRAAGRVCASPRVPRDDSRRAWIFLRNHRSCASSAARTLWRSKYTWFLFVRAQHGCLCGQWPWFLATKNSHWESPLYLLNEFFIISPQPRVEKHCAGKVAYLEDELWIHAVSNPRGRAETDAFAAWVYQFWLYRLWISAVVLSSTSLLRLRSPSAYPVSDQLCSSRHSPSIRINRFFWLWFSSSFRTETRVQRGHLISPYSATDAPKSCLK